MPKSPVVVMITSHKKHPIVDINIFSSIEKAKARFLMICAEYGITYSDSKSIHNDKWFVKSGNTTLYIEWKDIL